MLPILISLGILPALLAPESPEPHAARLYKVTVDGVVKQVSADELTSFQSSCGAAVQVRVEASAMQRFAGFGVTFEYPDAMQVITKREKIQDVIVVKHPAGFLVAVFFVRGSGDPEVETLSFFVESMRADLSSRGWLLARKQSSVTRLFRSEKVEGAKLRGSLASQDMNFELFSKPVAGGLLGVVAQYSDEDAAAATNALQVILQSLTTSGT